MQQKFQERGHLPGPRVGSGLLLRNKLRIHICWHRKRLYCKGMPRVRKPKRIALPHGLQSWILWHGISFRVVSGQSLWFRVLPGGTCISQPRRIPVRILGCRQDIWTGVSYLLLSFPKFFKLGESLDLSQGQFPHTSGWYNYKPPCIPTAWVLWAQRK